MSVRNDPSAGALASTATDLGAAIAEAQPDQAHLAEGAAYQTAAPENPLVRNLVVSVRASLNGKERVFTSAYAPTRRRLTRPPRPCRALPAEEPRRLAAVDRGAQVDL